MSALLFACLAGLIGAMDLTWRAVLRAAPILGLLVAFYWSEHWSLAAIAWGCAIPWVAGLPLGDRWVGAMVGAWVGVAGIMLCWAFALWFGCGLWILYRTRIIDWPGDTPFTPFVLVPALLYLLVS